MGFPTNLYLTIFDGERSPYEVRLSNFDKEIISFGRAEDNDIVLNSIFVSRHHGVIYMDHGNVIIQRLPDCKNGLWYHGKKIKSTALRDGTYIRVFGKIEEQEIGVLLVSSIKEESIVWNSIPVTPGYRITIGRDPSCNIVLDHVSISRVHAYVEERNGKYYIADNGSTNGVLLNGKKLLGRKELKEKDIILITNSKLVFTAGSIVYCMAKSGISVETKNVLKQVGKKKLTICDNVNLTINPGELVAIIGGSGAGKTSIMNCISGYSTPTSGQVLVNDVDLYQNYETLKYIIGYVPQKDIVYDNLTVYDMLRYSARLRLPKDVTSEEIDEIVNKVIDTVELSHRSDALVRSLSGGQRKRASIAVELLTDPNLFFLDEPTSGLDPGTERNLIRTLKGMTSTGKTVILVTHSTLGMQEYDKILFMGTGGKLCFAGSYNDALRFFETDDIVNVYEMISAEPDVWQAKYERLISQQNSGATSPKKTEIKNSNKKGYFRQFGILSTRYTHLLMNDRQRMLLLLLQAPLLGFLVYLVANDKFARIYESTISILFVFSCCAFWIGIMSALQEICKERVILKREYMTGLNLGSYILSKMVVLSVMCVLQSLILTLTIALLVNVDKGGGDFWRPFLEVSGIIGSPFTEFFVTTALVSISAAAMGILVSALFTNADRVMTIAPILLMPQILFSGMLFALDGISKKISYFINCRWAMEAYGSIINLGKLDLQMTDTLAECGADALYVQGPELIDPLTGGQLLSPADSEPMHQYFEYAIKHKTTDTVYYHSSTEHLILAWMILIFLTLFFAILARVVLSINIKDERR